MMNHMFTFLYLAIQPKESFEVRPFFSPPELSISSEVVISQAWRSWLQAHTGNFPG